MPPLRRQSRIGDHGAVDSIHKPAAESKETWNKDKESASKEAVSKDAKESKEKKPAKKK
jgi:hypothetical protein